MAQAKSKTEEPSDTPLQPMSPPKPQTELSRSDEQWVEQLRSKNEQVFQEFIDVHTPYLRQLLSRLMAYSPEVDDVIQTTYLSVWKKIDSFRCECTLKTWVTQIAIYQSRNHQRSFRRWIQRAESWLQHHIHTTEHANSANENSESTDLRWQKIQSAMSQLSYQDRELIVLHFLHGHSIRELAQIHNARENTIEVRLHRAKNRLKQLIEQPEHI